MGFACMSWNLQTSMLLHRKKKKKSRFLTWFNNILEGFCFGKFGRVADQAVLDNQPLRKHFRWTRLRYKRQALLKI